MRYPMGFSVCKTVKRVRVNLYLAVRDYVMEHHHDSWFAQMSLIIMI